MMPLYNINNNIRISNSSYLGVYQEKSEKWDIFQEMNICLGWNQTKTIWRKCSACCLCNNQYIQKNTPQHSWKGDGCSGIIDLNNQNIDGETYT